MQQFGCLSSSLDTKYDFDDDNDDDIYIYIYKNELYNNYLIKPIRTFCHVDSVPVTSISDSRRVSMDQPDVSLGFAAGRICKRQLKIHAL